MCCAVAVVLDVLCCTECIVFGFFFAVVLCCVVICMASDGLVFVNFYLIE